LADYITILEAMPRDFAEIIVRDQDIFYVIGIQSQCDWVKASLLVNVALFTMLHDIDTVMLL